MKNILVTGASEGIGRAIATRLATEDGNRLFLLARNEERLSELADAIGGNSEIIACDIRNVESIRRAIDSVMQLAGGIDVLINNAGV